MNALPQAISTALADPLRSARTAVERGRRAIGAIGRDIPVELVLAAGAFPVLLPSFADLPTQHADQVLEPGFTPLVRSVVEQWLAGQFEFFDAIVFSRGDDSAQRSYYYLCELQRTSRVRGPRPLVFDVAKIPRATSLAHTEAALRQLAAELGTDEHRLPEAIKTRNHRRALCQQLEQQRHTLRPPPGSHVAKLMRAADTLPAEDFDEVLSSWLLGDFPPRPAPRLLLLGTSPPDERLHETVERCGGCVVAEVGEHSPACLGTPIAELDGPFEALARHYHALRTGPRSFEDMADQVVQTAVASRADAAIFWLIDQDEALAWQLPSISAALARERIPLLTLTGRRWNAADGTLEEIARFTQELKTST